MVELAEVGQHGGDGGAGVREGGVELLAHGVVGELREQEVVHDGSPR